jgi:hypothetical protein
MTPKLKLVESPESPEAQFEEVLRELFTTRETIHRRLKRVDMAIAANGRLLAKERGVAFIRFESLQQEFGGR